MGIKPKRGGNPPNENKVINVLILLIWFIGIEIKSIIWNAWKLFNKITNEIEIRL